MFMNTQKQSNRKHRRLLLVGTLREKKRVQKEKKEKTARPEEAKERLWAKLTKGSSVYL